MKNRYTLFLFPYITIMGTCVVIFNVREIINGNILFQETIIGSILISLLISSGLSFMILYKVIIVTESQIKIKFPFLMKTFTYESKDILGCREIDNNKWFGKYKSFHLKSSDDNFYMFSQNEFRNYKEMATSISSKFPETEIPAKYNYKPVLILLFTVLAVALVNLIASI